MKRLAASIRSSFAVLLLCFVYYTHAMDLYVSNDGLDQNPGTRDKPLRSLSSAADRAKAGDTVIIRGGVYRDTLVVSHSGTVDKPLTFVAAHGEKVVITGSDIVNGWQPYEGGIVQVRIPKSLERGFNQVFLDGRMLPVARFPDETNTDLLKPTFADMKADEDHISSAQLTQPDGFWNGGFVAGRFGHKWTFQCATVTEYKKGTLTLSTKSGPWFTGNGVGYVTGVLKALDTPSEWHIENGVLYLWPPKGADLAAARVEVKQRSLCVDFKGQSHVVVKGIAITTGSVRLVGNCNVLEDCNVTYPSHFTRFPWSGYASDGGDDEGHNGILVQGNSNTIRGCVVRFSAGSGVVIRGFRNLITRCEISDIDYSGTYACPISLRPARDKAYGENRIRFNTIRRTGRDCIQFYGALADDIRYNDISESGLLCQDLGMIYSWGRDGKGTRIAYNWVHDNKGKGPNPGVYLDNYCRNFIVDHNVIWNCEAGVRINGPAEGHRIYNNTLFHCQDVGAHTYHAAWPDKMFESDWPEKVYAYDKGNNLFLGTEPAVQLEDWTNSNFRLKAGAAAIDSGEQVAGITDAFRGKAPDLGAYESGGAGWLPGKNGRAEQSPSGDRLKAPPEE